MNCKHKHKDLSLSQKLEIIQLTSEVFQTELSQWFGCSQSTISKILDQKDEHSMKKADDMENHFMLVLYYLNWLPRL